jgi:hypothetical protein
VCGEVFSCVKAFDAHRTGPISHRYCLKPGEVRRADGKKMFERVDYEVMAYYWRRRDARDSTATDRMVVAYSEVPRSRGRRSTVSAALRKRD